MAPIVVEGNTLGEIHRNYNKLLNDAVVESTLQDIEDINYDDPDLNNLFKIDYACRYKDVDYVLKVFKCQDMLYCSKAIKGSTWLITEPQYSYIINADYLFSKLFPEMMTTARNKLLMHIRLHLRDEKRAQDMFIHLKERNLKSAMKWMPYCSATFITENIVKHVHGLSLSVLLRLCEISLNFLHIYCNTVNCHRVNMIHDALKYGMKYANKDIEKYLAIFDSVEKHRRPLINPKTTKLIMKRCPQRILNHLEQYIDHVHIETFAKYIKQDEAKEFILHIMNGNFTDNVRRQIKPFLLRLSEKDRFEFVKERFIDSKNKELCPLYVSNSATLENIYMWYQFANFDEAFNNLIKLIRSESNPNERLSMIFVVLGCAKNNLQNIHNLLEYFRGNHINETLKFKINFINTFLDATKPYTFGEKAWRILNDIFISMELYYYTESEHLLKPCIRCIMLYKIIHNESIPEVILLKFNFNTFKKERNKLDNNHKEKIFEYLCNYAIKELEKHYKNLKNTDHEFEETIIWINNTLDLFVDWDKDLTDYPNILIIIKEISQYSKQKVPSTLLKRIFDKNKSWRKLLLYESILLNASENALINALKHSPELMHSSNEEVKALCLNDKLCKKHLLKKLRIYKAHLANEFKELYYSNLDQQCGLKSTLTGLCTLLSPKELSLLIEKFIPLEDKINWNQIDEQKLSLQKHIAKYMHVARPQPPLSLILLYAKGDYLQHVLPSLSSTLHNITSVELREETLNLNNIPVSLQKHIIREAFIKLQFDELLVILSSVWKTTKNCSIRAIVFKSAFNLLCKETDVTAIERIWYILKNFIDNLTLDENKSIFITLAQVGKVPIQIRPEFCIKSYKLLIKLPERSNSEYIICQVITSTIYIMEFMDAEFMTEILIKYRDIYFKKDCPYYIMDVMSAFLLSTQNEQFQIQRFEHVMLPLLEKVNAIWNFEKDNFLKSNMTHLLNRLLNDIKDIVFKKNMPMPIKLFSLILNELEKTLSFEENHMLITSWRLALRFITTLDICMKTNKVEDDLSGDCNHENIDNTSQNQETIYIYIQHAIKNFSKICVQYLNEDIQYYGTSVIISYGKALNEVFDRFFDINIIFELCEAILDCSEAVGFLLVLRILPDYSYDLEVKRTDLIKRIALHSDNEVKILCSTLRYKLDL